MLPQSRNDVLELLSMPSCRMRGFVDCLLVNDNDLWLSIVVEILLLFLWYTFPYSDDRFAL